jgi:hypothetical protein
MICGGICLPSKKNELHPPAWRIREYIVSGFKMVLVLSKFLRVAA